MSQKLRVLFVDDEPRILDGLRRMMHSLRQQWDGAFAQGAHEALERLAAEPFDAIICDMRMPGMTGVDLLDEVRRTYPDMPRFALSGHASKTTVFQSIGVVHQYLAKPCDGDAVESLLLRTQRLRHLLPSRRLRRAISQLRALPSPAAVYDAFLRRIEEPDASVRAVARCIACDVGMSLRVLQLVSSTFFHRSSHVPTPGKAAESIGVELLRTMAKVTPAFARFEDAPPGGRLEEESDHALLVASFSRRIAQVQNAPEEMDNLAYIGGLFHDVGRIVFATTFREEDRLLRASGADENALLAAERDLLGAAHTQVGAYLLGLWGLPQAAVDAAACHHEIPQMTGDAFDVTVAVRAADLLAHELAGPAPSRPAPRLEEAQLVRAGWLDRLPEWRQSCAAAYEEILHEQQSAVC